MAAEGFTPLTNADKDEEGKAHAQHGSESPKDQAKHRMEFVVLVLVWWVLAIYVAFMFKWTRAGDSTMAIHPLMLLWLVNMLAGLVAWLLSKLLQKVLHKGAPPEPLEWSNVGRLMALGLIEGLALVCLHWSALYMPTYERLMIQNINVPCLMIVAWFARFQKMTYLRAAVAVLMVVGGVLLGVGVVDNSGIATTFLGRATRIGLQLASIALFTGFWTASQHVTQRSETFRHLTKLQIVSFVQPVTGLFCFVLTLVLEIDGLLLENWLNPMLLLRVPALALGVLAITWSQFFIVQLSSAVTMGMLMDLLVFPLALPGLLLAREAYGGFSIAGFAVCCIATMIYVFSCLRKPGSEHANNATADPPPAT
eukprot:CAMPEP_0179275296 /NCGR_PEP_ID=MMETSP0797-20121207/33988_1 /TAXON_ID=47934 /ORGANISM="Dinophysis acuminata, Strain DAEP01" /LENGTH=366 /DNA_ID=CAMNT_0020983815 /DNA_START=41 /DNA_END=1141 /DNA_ORIENTATION=+